MDVNVKKTKNFVILFLTLLFLFVGSLFAPLSLVSAATLYFSPSSGVYEQGSTLRVNIYTDTSGDSVNAVQANFSYPTDKLQFSSISTAGSVLGIIAEKKGGGGFVKIGGGSYLPFSGRKFIAAVFFKVLANSGSATLSFAGDSAVVRSTDNQDALTSRSSATFTFSERSPESLPEDGLEPGLPPRISELTVENLTKNTAKIKWKTDIDSTSSVEFGLTPSYGLLATSDKLVTDHEVDLPQGMLLPGTTYHFRVVSKGSSEAEAKSEDSSFTTQGYKVVLNLSTKAGRPAVGAEVMFYSKPQKGVTDKDGKVEFSDVSPGKHGLIIRYKGITEIQEINVGDIDTPQVFDIRLVSDGMMLFRYLPFVPVGLVLLVALVLFVKLLKNRQFLKKF